MLGFIWLFLILSENSGGTVLNVSW